MWLLHRLCPAEEVETERERLEKKGYCVVMVTDAIHSPAQRAIWYVERRQE
jgi:hypothetical protein